MDGYIDWCEEWCQHPGFDWAIIPDVIDGSEAENDAMIAGWPRSIAGVPVWHMHESLDRLECLCRDWRRIAIGSSGAWPTPGRRGWWNRMIEVMGVVCDEEGRPRTRLHGLRMLSTEIFPKLPFASADSTNVAQNSELISRFGMYIPPTQSQRRETIASRIEHENSAAIFVPPKQMILTLQGDLT